MTKDKCLDLVKQLGYEIAQECNLDSKKILTTTMHLSATLLSANICLCLKGSDRMHALDMFYQSVKKMLENAPNVLPPQENI